MFSAIKKLPRSGLPCWQFTDHGLIQHIALMITNAAGHRDSILWLSFSRPPLPVFCVYDAS